MERYEGAGLEGWIIRRGCIIVVDIPSREYPKHSISKTLLD